MYHKHASFSIYNNNIITKIYAAIIATCKYITSLHDVNYQVYVKCAVMVSRSASSGSVPRYSYTLPLWPDIEDACSGMRVTNFFSQK
jgi:hypothetical protein